MMHASKATVVGLGAIGRALAATLVRAGHDVAVWNRTPGRADELVAAGAQAPATLEEALAHGEVVLFALTDYDACTAAFAAPLAAGALRDRIAVNLSTGSAGEARAAQQAFAAGGAAYIDGVVGCFPSAIGTADAVLRYSGDAAAYDRALPVLTALGDDTRHAGPDVGTGNALQLAVFGFCTVVTEAVAAGTGTDLLDASLRYLRAAVDAGRGTEEISAVYEVAGGAPAS